MNKILLVIGSFSPVIIMLGAFIYSHIKNTVKYTYIQEHIKHIDKQLSNHITDLKKDVKSVDNKVNKISDRISKVEGVING